MSVALLPRSYVRTDTFTSFETLESIQRFSLAMPSPDFAAAQDSVLARRQLRAVEAQALQELQNNSQISHKSTRLPIPRRLNYQVINLWRILKGRESTRPAFRVGQLDAELLDEELLQLLKHEVGEGLKFWGVGPTPPKSNMR